MKKINILLSVICTSVSIVFIWNLPKIIPVHYSDHGIDRYGSRWELMVIPITIIITSIVFGVFEKKSKKDVVKASKISFVSFLITLISFISQLNLIFDTYLSVYGVIYKKCQDSLFISIFFIILGFILCSSNNVANLYLHVFNIQINNKNYRCFGFLLIMIGLFISAITIYTMLN